MERYQPVTLLSPIDPNLYEWVPRLPEKIRNNSTLMDCLLRFVGRIYAGNDGVCEGVNPFYKIVELLECDKLYYDSLEAIQNYYHIDIIGYLTCNNRGEYYFGYPCNNAKQLKSALSSRKNQTGCDTLTNILSSMVK